MDFTALQNLQFIFPFTTLITQTVTINTHVQSGAKRCALLFAQRCYNLNFEAIKIIFSISFLYCVTLRDELKRVDLKRPLSNEGHSLVLVILGNGVNGVQSLQSQSIEGSSPVIQLLASIPFIHILFVDFALLDLVLLLLHVVDHQDHDAHGIEQQHGHDVNHGVALDGSSLFAAQRRRVPNDAPDVPNKHITPLNKTCFIRTFPYTVDAA